MIGALWTGITGLDTFQKALTSESNNITNTSTIAYKEDRVSFEDLMYTKDVAGSIGKGSSVGNVSKAMYQQGGIRVTNDPYHVAIEGRGYFVVNDPQTNENYFSRAGNFKIVETGYLQTQDGKNVLGLVTNANEVNSTASGVTKFDYNYSNFIASQAITNTNYLQSINSRATDYSRSATDDSSTLSGSNYKTRSAKINDIEALISDYKDKLDKYASYKTFSLDLSNVQIGDEFKVNVNGKTITQSFASATPPTDPADIETFLSSKINELSQQIANASNSTTYYNSTAKELVISSKNASMDSAFVNDTSLNIANTTNSVFPSDVQKTQIDFSGYEDLLKTDTDYLKVTINGNQILQYYVPTVADQTFKDDLYASLSDADKTIYGDPTGTITQEQQDMYNLKASSLATIKAFSDKVSAIQGLTSSVDTAGLLNVESLIPGEYVKITDPFINDTLYNTTTIQDAQVGLGVSMMTSSREALKDALQRANAEFLEITNTISLDDEINNNFDNMTKIQMGLKNLEITDDTMGTTEIIDGVVYVKDGDNKFLVGKLETAAFLNEQDLTPLGGNLYQATDKTGPMYNATTMNNLVSNSVEESSANMANSLTALLIYQKAFDANSKSITTSDEFLKTAIGMVK